MNLTLEQNSFSTYNIKDNNGRIIYICKKQLSISKHYIIFDENNLQLAELKQTPFSRTLYDFYINGSVVDKLELHTKTPLKKYQLKYKKWLIGGDITYTNYTILNDRYDKVLDMKQESPKEPYTWKINLYEENDKLLAILTVLNVIAVAK